VSSRGLKGSLSLFIAASLLVRSLNSLSSKEMAFSKVQHDYQIWLSYVNQLWINFYDYNSFCNTPYGGMYAEIRISVQGLQAPF
jgi:hypothetical protein